MGKRVLGLASQNRFPEDVPGVGMIDKSLRRKVTTVKKRCRPVCAHGGSWAWLSVLRVVRICGVFSGHKIVPTLSGYKASFPYDNFRPFLPLF